MQTKLKVSKVVYPNTNTTLNEWAEEFQFGKGYIKPTPYFQNNELNFSVYKKLTLTERIFNFITRTF